MPRLTVLTVVINSAPGSTDDRSKGYDVGTFWFNYSSGNLYVLKDNSVGAAVWSAISGGAGGGVTSVTGTAPIASSGGTTPAISLSNGGVSTAKLADGAVTNAKLADRATKTLIGRKTAGTGVPEDISPSDLASMFGTPDGTKFLADDGTLKTPAGGGGGSSYSGPVIQTISTIDTTSRSTSSSTFVDSGVAATLSSAYRSTLSKVRVRVSANISLDASTSSVVFTLKRGSTDITPIGKNHLAAVTINTATYLSTLTFEFVDAPGTTTPETYHLMWRSTASAGVHMNDDGAGFLGVTTMVLEEIDESLMGSGSGLLGSAAFEVSGGAITSSRCKGIVASVTRLSVGKFQITFTANQPDSDYICIPIVPDANAHIPWGYMSGLLADYAIDGCKFQIDEYTGPGAMDPLFCRAAILRY